MVQVRSLGCELPYALGVVNKIKKKKKSLLCNPRVISEAQLSLEMGFRGSFGDVGDEESVTKYTQCWMSLMFTMPGLSYSTAQACVSLCV